MTKYPADYVRIEPDRGVRLLDDDRRAVVRQLVVRLFDSLLQKRPRVQRFRPHPNPI
jgi:hypothetical protein